MHRAISLLLLVLPVFGQTPFSWKDLQGGRIELSEGGKPALVYNHGPQWKPGGGKDIVRENLRLTAFPSQGGAREIEVELTWEALAAPVTLRGSAEAGKSYGGFSARFAPREGTTLRADGEILKKDEDLNPRQWAELEGVYSGKRAAFRITPDPKNSGVPYQWCLRNYGFVGASFPGRTATVDSYTLQPGKPLTLKIRVQVRDVP